MKSLPIIFTLIIFLSSCNSDKLSSNSTDNSLKPNTSSQKNDVKMRCFQRVEGLLKKDTSTIQLNFRNTEVTGQFDHLPYEKDSRKGIIRAQRSGNEIKGLWIYQQEGMKDSLPIAFKLIDNGLVQKPYNVDESTGRQTLSDSSEYSIQYKSIPCN